MPDFLPQDGVIVDVPTLALPRARELAHLLNSQSIPYARLVECLAVGGEQRQEAVILEVEVERGQVHIHDIQRLERFAVWFRDADDRPPEVLSLRPDFPDVPHLNQTRTELPRSLCLYDQPWSALKLRWTPALFVDRLRHWLAQTANGTLHESDQPLEPLLLEHHFKIVLPHDLFGANGNTREHLVASLVTSDHDRGVLLTRRPQAGEHTPETPFVVIPLEAAVQEHGVIRRTPENLRDLAVFTTPAGIDLLPALRSHLKAWDRRDELLKSKLIVVIKFPKKRRAEGVVESLDVWAFATVDTLADVGKHIGAWDLHQGKPALLLVPVDSLPDGAEVKIATLLPIDSFSPAQAAAMNGVTESPIKDVAVVGAGALGSQLVLNIARAGAVGWRVIDEDLLLPHNLARHGAIGPIGWPKAKILSASIQRLFDRPDAATDLVIDVLNPGKQAAALTDALNSASAILDCSASVPVARHLAHNVASAVRRLSYFMNPNARDSILIAEDRERRYPLDALEMQYYRAVMQESSLKGHLSDVPHRLRYAMSCRDITSDIPQDRVALHAAIGSRAIRRALANPVAAIEIWRSDPETLAVNSVSIAPAPIRAFNFGEWTLCTDESFLARISALRIEKLPNETGGVLVGSFDLSRRIVYVVDTIPSPPDSQEWPTLYIRGSEQLAAQMEQVATSTGGNLEYIGEWHSHPEKCPASPSTDDFQVFIWLTELMDSAGLPALMLIAGDQPDLRFFLGTMEKPR